MKIFDIEGKLLFEDTEATLKKTVENAMKTMKGGTVESVMKTVMNTMKRGLYWESSIYLENIHNHRNDMDNFSGTSLRNAKLEGAELRNANLNLAYLMGANLKWACLEYANLGGANLEGANLSYTNFYRANLVGANLKDAKIDDAFLIGAKMTKFDLYKIIRHLTNNQIKQLHIVDGLVNEDR